MPDEQKSKLRLEIAHVLFIDIVGYSKLLITSKANCWSSSREWCATHRKRRQPLRRES